MSERTTFVLKIAGLILVTILIALALYMVFFRNTVSTIVTETPGTGISGTLPGSETGTPAGTTGTNTTPGGTTGTTTLTPSNVAKGGETFTTLLTNTAVKSPTVTTNGTVAYYDPADGKFYTIGADGKVVAMSNVSFPKAETVTFDTDAMNAVIEFPDGSNVVYDFEAAKQVTLPSHWEDFSFSGDGNTLAAKSIGNNASNRALVVTNTDGTSTKVLASLGENDEKVSVSWSPNNTVLGFSATGGNTGNSFGQQEIYLIGVDGEASGALIVDGSHFRNIWAPDGKHLLYSVSDPGNAYKPTLWYADSRGDRKGDMRKKMSIVTVVEKCTFASATLAYCGVPRVMPAGGGSDPSLVTEPDDIYKLDISTGNATLVAIPASDTKVFSPSISSDGKNFFYADEAGRLNVIRLK